MTKKLSTSSPVKYYQNWQKAGFSSHSIDAHQRLQKQAFLGACLILIFIWTAEWAGKYAAWLSTSLLEIPAVEFVGTTTPIEKVPDWVALTDSERHLSFSQLTHKLIPLPDYNIKNFQRGLDYQTATDAQRNAYLTYPVPNLGNYDLDGTENSGSHPGVDIKVPIGTPVRAIANGIVYKTDYQKTGFGNFVSIAHPSVPDPENPTQKTTLISSYAHLSKVKVTANKTVHKGDIIGYSGNSGLATSPHLHFQIDRLQAPFVPYWPFTWAEIQQRGYDSFFAAVRAGFNQKNAQIYTVSPLHFINQFDNWVPNNLVAAAEPNIIAKVVGQSSSEAVNNIPDVPSAAKPIVKNTNQSHSSAPLPIEPRQVELVDSQPKAITSHSRKSGQMIVTFVGDQNFVPGKTKTMTLKINQASLGTQDQIILSSTLGRQAAVRPDTLTLSDFDEDGATTININPKTDDDFKLIVDGDFGTIKSPNFKAQIFNDVPGNHSYATAIEALVQQKIIQGYPDGSFRPNKTINRAEALKIILISNDIPTTSQSNTNNFPDVDTYDWFAPYVNTAYQQEIIKGYPDGNFKPGNTITRAEFLKVAILSANMVPTSGQSYDDVPSQAWFADYFAFSAQHGLLRGKGDNNIAPQQAITRAEAAEVLYKLQRL